jgi:urease accessory protein
VLRLDCGMRHREHSVAEIPPLAANDAGWRAHLTLGFALHDARTVLGRRAHVGPLVVQKPLYPEGDAVCQCIVVHPPGGIAGGDQLELDVSVAAGAHAQLTTPGAAKWYRTTGPRATQRLRFAVGADAVLEWMPQGTIVFDGADAASDITIRLEGNAAFIGWDIVCLGRTASAERFTRGGWRQRGEVWRDNALIWSERLVLEGNSPWLSSPAGLNDAPVFGTFLAMFDRVEDATLNACRAVTAIEGDGAVTRLPGSLVARYRGSSFEAAQIYFSALWLILRPAITGRAAVTPRIWRT